MKILSPIYKNTNIQTSKEMISLRDFIGPGIPNTDITS